MHEGPRKPGRFRATVMLTPCEIEVWVDSDNPEVERIVAERIGAMKERLEAYTEQEVRRLLPGATVEFVDSNDDEDDED